VTERDDSTVINQYFKSLYRRTMETAYEGAYQQIVEGINERSMILDCGASSGGTFDVIAARCKLDPAQYKGLEWHAESSAAGRAKGLDIVEADLNGAMPFADSTFSCVYALSLLEHLLNPCRFMLECRRVLQPGGRLVLLTPNISTLFTAALILMGRMPSSGPHPDSDALLHSQALFRVSSQELQHDTETDTPAHRHLVVFSFLVLRDYLGMLGFTKVSGRGFGLYPFPNMMQPMLERIDPYHCHQMVFVAEKPANTNG
jgi:SAM-dependent methyltransferase